MENGSEANSSVPMDGFGVYPDIEYRVLIGCLFTLAVLGLVMNLLVTAVIVRFKWYTKISYLMIESLNLSDFLNILLMLLGMLAGLVRLNGGDLTQSYNDAIGVLGQFGWFATQHNMLVVAINRYVSACHFSRYTTIFSKKNTNIMLAAAWVVAALEALPITFDWYYVTYEPIVLMFAYGPDHVSQSFSFYDFAISGGSCALMIFCYAAVVVKVNKSKRVRRQTTEATSAQDKRASKKYSEELQLTVQFAIISLVFVSIIATFFIVTAFTFAGYDIPRTVLGLIAFLTVAHNTVNPYVYMMFNSTLRRKTALLCQGKAGQVADTTYSGHSRADARSAAAHQGNMHSIQQPTIND